MIYIYIYNGSQKLIYFLFYLNDKKCLQIFFYIFCYNYKYILNTCNETINFISRKLSNSSNF